MMVFFSSCPMDHSIQSALLDELSSFIPASDVSVCEGPLSCDEDFKALQGMAKGKSPGQDGLPAEFYICFWEVLGSDFGGP